MPSDITTALRADPPLVQSADYTLDGTDRQKIDDQIIGCQQHLEDSLLNGTVASWFTLDGSSAALAAGQCFCLSSSTLGTVTLATTGAMATAGMVAGVALQAAAPGSKVRGAVAGTISALITGLAALSPGLARLSTAGTGGIARVSSAYQPGDFPIGSIDNAGGLTLNRGTAVVGDLIGALGEAGFDGQSVTIAGGQAGDSSHHAGAVDIDLGETAAFDDGLSAELRILAGTAGTVMTVAYDDGSVSGERAVEIDVPAVLVRLTSEVEITGNVLVVGTFAPTGTFTMASPTAVVPGASYTALPGTGNVVTIGPIAAPVVLNIATAAPGVPFSIFVKQNGSGGHAITWHASVIFASGISNTSSTAINGVTWWQVVFFGGVAYIVGRAILS